MDTTEKKLLMKRPSEAAVKLANSIYYTAIQRGELEVCLSLKQLCKALKDCDETDWYAKSLVTELLEELCEPVAVKDFVYDRKEIKWQAISFLSYTFYTEEGTEYADIEINKMFIDVMKQLEAEPYINFQ